MYQDLFIVHIWRSSNTGQTQVQVSFSISAVRILVSRMDIEQKDRQDLTSFFRTTTYSVAVRYWLVINGSSYSLELLAHIQLSVLST